METELTTEQMTMDLILGGWHPVRYERTTGSIWVGVHHLDYGLIYRDTDCMYGAVRDYPVSVKSWPQHILDAAGYTRQFRCRWVDVEHVLASLYMKVKEVAP